MELDRLGTANEGPPSGRTARSVALTTGLEHEAVRIQHDSDDQGTLGQSCSLGICYHSWIITDTALERHLCAQACCWIANELIE